MIALLTAAVIMSSFQNVRVERVIDGDTFVVTLEGEPDLFGRSVPVRIKGIDTPELRSKKRCEKTQALMARDKLISLLDTAGVDLNFCERDKYWRLLCTVRSNESQDVGEEMLRSKWAKLYDGKTKRPWRCL